MSQFADGIDRLLVNADAIKYLKGAALDKFLGLKLSTVSSAQLMDFYRSVLVVDQGGDAPWISRALFMLAGLIDSLIALRDQHGVPLSFHAIEQAFHYDSYHALAKDKRLREKDREKATQYLDSLPNAGGHRCTQHYFITATAKKYNASIIDINLHLLANDLRSSRNKDDATRLVVYAEASGFMTAKKLLAALDWLEDPQDFILRNSGAQLKREILSVEMGL